jgi:exonuclease VII small subunit
MTPTKDQNLMIKKENNFTATKSIVSRHFSIDESMTSCEKITIELEIDCVNLNDSIRIFKFSERL